MMMSSSRPLPNRVKPLRLKRGWSQDQLAAKAGISRTAVSSIEVNRLVPSVGAALALAAAFGCRVEDLFGAECVRPVEEAWAWVPTGAPARFWRANVRGRIVRFPVEHTVAGMLPHDGIESRGTTHIIRDVQPETTLVLASCDPAAGLLASEYERATGFRMLPLQRSSREALDLLHQGLIHVAGIHLANADSEMGNTLAARAVLGDGFSLLRFATWDEGLAMSPSAARPSVDKVVHDRFRWVGREAGTGARQCQDEVLGIRPKPRRLAKDHRGVAEAIRCGFADVGVCLRLVSEQAGLRFIHVRNEAYDLCFPASLLSDIRMKKLIEVLRSTAVRKLFESLPGYELSQNIDVTWPP
jgi:molybdate-binding protein/DNA-binding XRE family transcriptional regulator